MWSIMYHVVLKEGQVLLWVHHLALARPQVPYSGPGQGFGTTSVLRPRSVLPKKCRFEFRDVVLHFVSFASFNKHECLVRTFSVQL